jgi:hypothetical protein
MQLSHFGTFKALKDHTFMSVNGTKYSGLSSSTGNCLWTGYADLCISGTVCGQDKLTCASVRLYVDRIC